MRSAVLGAYFEEDAKKRRAFVSAATRLTHTDPEAETAALAVAEAAAMSVGQSSSVEAWLSNLPSLGVDEQWKEICRKLTAALAARRSVSEFADELGLQRGVTGYACHSVPAAIYAWLRHPDDFRSALISVLDCGGDADTVGAILGALMGARLGRRIIPPEWLDGICDRPRSTGLLVRVAERLSQQRTAKGALGQVRYFWPLLVIRNGSSWATCGKVSPGCQNRYAEGFARRLGKDVWGLNKPRETYGDKHWNEPLAWNRKAEKAGKRRRVFCSSMCDVFENHPTIDQEREKLWPLIRATPRLDWQILTKRAERIPNKLPADWGQG